MKKRFIEMIEREASLHSPKQPGRIIAKMNQLEDREVTDALYRASEAGVKIDLIVRGFCWLRPGVPGMSENIRVIRVIGRFLEHGRIFWFRNGQEDPLDGEFYIGSADWMYRNLNTRVEAVCPIEDRHAAAAVCGRSSPSASTISGRHGTCRAMVCMFCAIPRTRPTDQRNRSARTRR